MIDQTDSSEVTALKQFCVKYAKLLVGVVVLFVIVLGGVNWWQNKRASAASDASQIFHDMVMAEMQNDTQTATAKGGQLISDYSKTPYAQFAGLLLAKMAVTEGELDKAADQLRWVANQSSAKHIAKHLATVRLAAVLQQQGKLDEALALVAKDPDQAYTTLYAQARGDIYVSKGELAEAKNAYILAMQSLPQGVQSPLLQMKLLDLGDNNEA